jgi:hypothetical protein
MMRERDDARATYEAKIRFDNHVMHEEQQKYFALARELGAAREALREYHAWVEAARQVPTVGPGNWMSPPEHYGEAVRAALAAREGE